MPGGTDGSDAMERRRARAVALYRMYRPQLFGTARLLLGDDTRADECVRAACVELCASDEISIVEDELHDMRVALLAAARRLDKGGARGRTGADPDQSDFPLVVFALQRLTGRQRECVVLRHYEGMTEGQIARAVGVSVGSVRTHYRRGMAHLTGWLSDVAATR
jgi:DNA-directed RNA polymerase specialized sigma24 family protein